MSRVISVHNTNNFNDATAAEMGPIQAVLISLSYLNFQIHNESESIVITL
jgi:hypothetical protein